MAIRQRQAIVPTLRDWWAKHGVVVLHVAVGFMSIAAVVWLGYECWRLLWGEAPIWSTSPVGAVDLRALHQLVHEWFAGRPVYRDLSTAVHPPATYVLLWPLLGWLDLAPARWLWAVTTLVALGWLINILVRESGARCSVERAFVALLPYSIYATGAAIGNGQLIVHLLPMLVAGLLLLDRAGRPWQRDLLAWALILATLVKPPVSLPFLWLVLFAPRGGRTAAVVALGYGVLTVFAISFQHSTPVALLQGWLKRSSSMAITGGYGNVANLHVWLGSLGLEKWILPSSLAILLALGMWSYRHRQCDIRVRMGVTAVVARFWTYHRWYDDAVVLLPMVALFRMAKRRPSPGGEDVVGGLLLAVMLLFMLAPGGLFLFPPPWNTVYVFGQVAVWAMTLAWLLRTARAERLSGQARAVPASPAPAGAEAAPVGTEPPTRHRA